MALIEPGKRAPNFTLVDQHGERHMLEKYRGRAVVLYFYPKDDTPDCTIQACQFRDHHPDFSKIDAAILGVSPDSAASHAAFAQNHDLAFPLLVDAPNNSKPPGVCAAYGAWQEKTLYGRKYMGVVRTTYLIDEEGVVRRRWDRVKVTGHAADVLSTLKLMRGAAPREMKPSKKRASEKKARRETRTRGEVAKKSGTRITGARIGRAAKVRGKGTPPARRSRARR